MVTLIVVFIALIVFLFFLWALMYQSGEQSYIEEKMYLDAWRNGLQRKDLVTVSGIQYRIENIENGVAELFRYSQENCFVLVVDLWPVE